MKIPKDTNQKLSGVPIKNRVYCYDGTIIIDFLNRTFMPLAYFVAPGKIHEIGAGTPPTKEFMADPEQYEESFVQVSKLYEYYCLFRQQVDYTAPVENRWKFGLMIKKLLLPKNGWQFVVKRVGRAQIWYAGPVMLRIKTSAEARTRFPVADPNVLSGQIEATQDDLSDRDEDKIDDGFDNTHLRFDPRDTDLSEDDIKKNASGPTGPESYERVMGLGHQTGDWKPSYNQTPGQFTDDPTLQ